MLKSKLYYKQTTSRTGPTTPSLYQTEDFSSPSQKARGQGHTSQGAVHAPGTQTRMLRPTFPGGVPYPPRPGEPGVRYAQVYPTGAVPPPPSGQASTYRDGAGQVFVRQPAESPRGVDRRTAVANNTLGMRTVPNPFYPTQLSDTREVQVLSSGRGVENSLVTVPASHLGLVQQQQQQQQQQQDGQAASKRARMGDRMDTPLRIDTREQKEPGYHPQVEAISPTPEDRTAERDDVRSTKDDLLQKISKVDREIAKAESQIAKLKKKQHDLEDAANRPTSDSATEEEKPGQSIAQSVYSENRRKAGQSHASLEKFSGKNDLPLYNQPSDTEVYSTNKKNYTQFKKKLVEYFKKRSDEREQRDRYMTVTYCKLTSQWTKKVDRVEGRKSRKEREGRAREQYEKIFPELRKQREDKERDARLGTRGVVKSDADFEDVIERLQEQEMEDKKMHSYAVIPPLLLPPDERRRKFTNNNGLMQDPMQIYKEREYVNMWTDAEKVIFREKYLQQPKNFFLIATYLERKTVADCVQYYYLSKKTENYKQLLKKTRLKVRGQRRQNAAPQGEVIAPGLTGVVTRRKVEEMQGKEAQEGTSKGNSRSNTPAPATSKGLEENGESEKDAGKKKPDRLGRGVENKKSDNQNESSDEEETNQAVKTGPHPCVVCKSVVDTSRAAQKIHSSQLGITEEDLASGECRVCNTCWCKTLKKKHSAVCPVPTCTSNKGRSRGKLRHLPKKWGDLDKASKEIVMKELQLPDKTKHVCAACFTRITRRISVLECTENKVKKEEELVAWADEAVEKAKTSLRQYGTNWSKMSEAVRDKTEDQCKKFFYNQRKRLQLDKLVQEYKRASRPGGDDKPSLTSDEESGSSTSSCEGEAGGAHSMEVDVGGDKELKPPAIPPPPVEVKVEPEVKVKAEDYNSADTMSADETSEMTGSAKKLNQPAPAKGPSTVKGLMEAVIAQTLDTSKPGVTSVPTVAVTTAITDLNNLLQDAGPSPRGLPNYVSIGLNQNTGGCRPKEIGPPTVARPDQELRPAGQGPPQPSQEDGAMNLTVSRPDRSSPGPVVGPTVEHTGYQYAKLRDPVPESQGKEPPAAHGGQKPKTSHKDILLMTLGDPSFPHMFRQDNKSPAPYTDPRASVHSPGPLLVHRGDPRKELPTHGAPKSHPPPLHPNKPMSMAPGHTPGLVITPSRPGGSLVLGTPKAQPVHSGGVQSQHSPGNYPGHPRGSITEGLPVRRAQEHPMRKPQQNLPDPRSSSHPSMDAYKQAARASPYPSPYPQEARPSSEQPGQIRSNRSIIESSYHLGQILPKHPREPPSSGFPRTIDPHRREVPPSVDPRLDLRTDPRLYPPTQTPRFSVPSFGGRGDPRTEVRGDPRADIPGARGDPRAEIPGVRGDPRADRDLYRDSRHVQDPRPVPILDHRPRGGQQIYPPGFPDPRTLPPRSSRSPPRQPHPTQPPASSQAGSIIQGRPKPQREVDPYPRHPHPEVSITKQNSGPARTDYAPNLDDLARLAETQQRLPERVRGVGPSQGPPILDPRALYEQKQTLMAAEVRSRAAQEVLGPPRGATSRDNQRQIDASNHHKMIADYNRMSENDQKAYIANLKNHPQKSDMSAASLIDLIITHQINRGAAVASPTMGGTQNLNPRRSPQASEGKESASKPPSHSPSVKMPDTLEVASGSGVRTSPGTMGEHIENMISKEVGRGNTGSPYPGTSTAEQHEHWKRRPYVVQDNSYRPPSQPRPPSNSHPGLSTDERVIQRVVQNASPGGSARPDKPPSRSMHEAISPPNTSTSYLPPHSMYQGQSSLEPTVAKMMAARRKEDTERAAAVSRSETGMFDYVKYKITEVMKNEKGGAAGPSDCKPPSSHHNMGPPHKRPLESEPRASPSDHTPTPESPNKRYKRDETHANDIPDSPESGDMVIDESARPDSAHSHKTNSPAPQIPSDSQHYPPGYRGPGAPPRSSPAPSGPRPPPHPSGGALARYEPLSDDD